MNRQQYYQNIFNQQQNNRFCKFIDHTNNHRVCNALCYSDFCAKHVLQMQRTNFVKKTVLKPQVTTSNDDYLFVDDN